MAPRVLGFVAAASIAAASGALAEAPTGSISKGDRELGQHLSSECVTCHLLSGEAVGGIPPIVGWPEDQFVAVMMSYKQRYRDNKVMQAIAGRLAKDEIEALAAYFGELKKPSPR